MKSRFDNAAPGRLPMAGGYRRRKSRRGQARFFRPRVEQLESRQMLSADLVGIELLPDSQVEKTLILDEVVADCTDKTAEEQVELDSKSHEEQDGQSTAETSRHNLGPIESTDRVCDIDFIATSESLNHSLEFDAVNRTVIPNGTSEALFAGVTNGVRPSGVGARLETGGTTGDGVTNGYEMPIGLTDNRAGVTTESASDSTVDPVADSTAGPAFDSAAGPVLDSAAGPAFDSAAEPVSDSIDIGPLTAPVVIVHYSAGSKSAAVAKAVPADLTTRIYQPIRSTLASDQTDRPHYFAAQSSLSAARWQVGSEPDVGSTRMLDVAGPDDLQSRRVVRLAGPKGTKQPTLLGNSRAVSSRVSRLGPVTMSAAREEFVSAVFATAESWLPVPDSTLQAKLLPVSLWPARESSDPKRTKHPEAESTIPATTQVPAPTAATHEVLRDPGTNAQPVAFIVRPEVGARDSLRREES